MQEELKSRSELNNATRQSLACNHEIALSNSELISSNFHSMLWRTLGAVEKLGEAINATAAIDTKEALKESHEAFVAFRCLMVAQSDEIQQLTTVPASVHPLQHLSKELAAVAFRAIVLDAEFGELLDRIEQMREVVRGSLSALYEGSGVPGIVSVEEYVGKHCSPPLAVIEKVVTLTSELSIDPSRQFPQEGFLTPYAKRDLETLLEKPGVRLFVLKYDQEPVGFYILVTGTHDLTDDAKKTAPIVEQCRLDIESRWGWASAVGVSASFRRTLYAMGVQPYDFLHGAMVQSAKALGITDLFGRVRSGVQANTAMASHFRVGWRKVGEVPYDGVPYAVLHVSLREQSPMTLPKITSELPLANDSGNGERISLPSHWIEKSISNFKFTEISQDEGGHGVVYQRTAADILSDRLKKLKTDHSLGVLECSDGIAIQARVAGIHYTVRQVVPNGDRWIYERRSGDRKIESFEEAVDKIVEDIQSDRASNW